MIALCEFYVYQLYISRFLWQMQLLVSSYAENKSNLRSTDISFKSREAGSKVKSTTGLLEAWQCGCNQVLYQLHWASIFGMPKGVLVLMGISLYLFIFSVHCRAGTVISETWEDGQALKDLNAHLVCSCQTLILFFFITSHLIFMCRQTVLFFFDYMSHLCK